MRAAGRPFGAGKRVLSGVAAGAIAVPLSFGMMGGTALAFQGNQNATPPAPINTAKACPPSQVPSAGFTDVPAGAYASTEINCIAAYNVTKGTTATTYSPAQPVNRGAMAAFFYRIGQQAGVTWDTTNKGQYSDVDNANIPAEFKTAIYALTNAGIVSGFGNGTYGPTLLVTRGQMSKFIALTLSKITGVTGSPAGSNDYFADDDGSVFEPYLNADAAIGVYVGDGIGKASPGANTTRADMAVFLARVIEVAVDAGKMQTKFPASNQTYTISPAAQQNKAVGTGLTDATSAVTYTVSGLGTAPVCVALFPATGTNAPATSNGNTTFTSSGGSGVAGNAAGAGTSNSNAAKITTVNGVSTGNVGATAVPVSPNNGSITFTVNTTARDATVPVVFSGADSNCTLEVDKTGTPTEAFGVGGTAVWAAAPATTGVYSQYVVQTVNTAAHTFEACNSAGTACATFTDNASGSTYSGQTNAGATVPLSQSQFESFLSGPVTQTLTRPAVPGDEVTVTYNAGGPSTFAFDTTDTGAGQARGQADVPAAPTGLSATYSSTSNNVTLKWTAPQNLDVVSYNVYRATVSSTGTVGNYSVITTSACTPASATCAVDTPAPAAGTYSYAVSAVNNEGFEGPTSTPASATVPAAATPGGVAGAPTLTDSRAQDNGTPFQMDSGDVIQLIYNEPMAASAAGSGASFRVSDGVNSGTITCGTNATCTLLPAGTYNGTAIANNNQVERILLTSALTSIGPGTSVAYPATITSVTNAVADQDEGLTLSLASGDKTIESTSAITPAPSTAGPTIVPGTASGTTATFTSNQPIAPNSFTTSDISGTAGTPASVSVSADGLTLTVTYATAPAGASTTILGANSVTNYDGRTGPATAQTDTF